jgi:hypothetical protein
MVHDMVAVVTEQGALVQGVPVGGTEWAVQPRHGRAVVQVRGSRSAPVGSCLVATALPVSLVGWSVDTEEVEGLLQEQAKEREQGGRVEMAPAVPVSEPCPLGRMADDGCPHHGPDEGDGGMALAAQSVLPPVSGAAVRRVKARKAASTQEAPEGVQKALTVRQLRAACKAQGLVQRGSKAELLARLA